MTPTRYETTRDKIAATLRGVPGIGRIFDSPKHARDWDEWLQHYQDEDGLIRVGWFSLVAAPEDANGPLGHRDATDEVSYAVRTETWRIEQFLGFKDDENEPSDYQFQLLCERIEAAFRFLVPAQWAGDTFRVSQISRTFSAPWWLTNQVLVHKAEWNLAVTHRIMNPS